MRAKKETFTLHMVLTKPPETLMTFAATLGQENGRDKGWHPESLNEAILEIAIYGDCLETYGVKPTKGDTPFSYPLPIIATIHSSTGVLHATRDIASVLYGENYYPTLEECLALALMSYNGPLTMCFDLEDVVHPASSHDALHCLQLAQTCYQSMHQVSPNE